MPYGLKPHGNNLRQREAHDEAGDDRREQDPRPRGGEPVEAEHCALRRRFQYDRGHALGQLVETGHRKLRVGDLARRSRPGAHGREHLFRSIHDLLAGVRAPAENEYAEHQPRQPCARDLAAAVTVLTASGALLTFLLTLVPPNLFRMPYLYTLHTPTPARTAPIRRRMAECGQPVRPE